MRTGFTSVNKIWIIILFITKDQRCFKVGFLFLFLLYFSLFLTKSNKANLEADLHIKWLSEEALQIAEKRREVKGKGRKERYTHLNVEFQGEIRKPSLAYFQCNFCIFSNANKSMKTIEWETLEILSRKLEIPREPFMQRWAQ